MDKQDLEELKDIIKELRQDFKDLKIILHKHFEEMEKDTNEFDNIEVENNVIL
jgi:N-acetylglutamate synthase-like GNAT family acetyltransferase